MSDDFFDDKKPFAENMPSIPPVPTPPPVPNVPVQNTPVQPEGTAQPRYISPGNAPQYQNPAAYGNTGAVKQPPTPPYAPPGPTPPSYPQNTQAPYFRPAYPQPPAAGYPYYPQQPPQPYYTPVSPPIYTPSNDKNNAFAAVSMVFGIVSVVSLCFFVFGWFVTIPLSIAGFILGIIGKCKGGGGMAIAGIVLNALSLLLLIVLFVIVFVFGIFADYEGFNMETMTLFRFLYT